MDYFGKKNNLKLNKNKFPTSLSLLIRSLNKPEDPRLNLILKLWYLEQFQKNNRWNKALIKKGIAHYSLIELSLLAVGFKTLFNTDKKYNAVFINYLSLLIEEKTAEENGLIDLRIKISQKSYFELLHTLSELKTSGEIHNSYRELAGIIYRAFSPETELKPSTIMDRLKNKKGYY